MTPDVSIFDVRLALEPYATDDIVAQLRVLAQLARDAWPQGRIGGLIYACSNDLSAGELSREGAVMAAFCGLEACSGKSAGPVLESFNLHAAERALLTSALETAGSIAGAAVLLRTTHFAVRRRLVKHRIAWPREGA